MSDGEPRAVVTWGGGMLFTGTDKGKHSVVYDENPTDPASKGFSPMTTLLTSLGACTGQDIVSILAKRKQKLTSLRVLLSGDRPEYGLPKPWTAIRVRYVLSGENLDRKFVEEAIDESMKKFCSVGATLRPTAKITHSYEIVA